jgi:hypothetical protein
MSQSPPEHHELPATPASLAAMELLTDLIDDLPPEVVEDLPPGIIDQIRNEGLETLPDEIIDRLPDTVVDRIPDQFLDVASNNPLFTAILVIVGLLAIVGFFYGVAKSAFKAAFFFGVIAAGSWYWFFNS